MALTQKSTGKQNYITSLDGKGYRYDIDGWNFAHIEGDPYERGYQHGWLLSAEIKDSIEVEKKTDFIDYGIEWDYLKEFVDTKWAPKLDDEWIRELKGIVDGTNARAATAYDVSDMLVHNGNMELTDYWWPSFVDDYYANGINGTVASKLMQNEPDTGADDRCSAFIATGSYTSDNKIVLAHNSFAPFEVSNFLNVCLDVVPTNGQHFIMQAQPGLIHSMSDMYESASLMVSETTIGGFWPYDPDGMPEFARIRKAIQYASTIDEFEAIMLDGNNGGYANTWLIGELGSNEIARFELGLKFWKLDRTKDGYYAGFNAPEDPLVRNLECKNSGYADIRRHQGARQVRIPQLIEANKGGIDADVAKAILADHYDVYLQKDNPCSRTVCGHYELDAREFMSMTGRPIPYQPRGAVDGVVGTSDSAREFKLFGRWCSSCGAGFNANKFLQAHPQYTYLKDVLRDRPSMPWTELQA
ncbi:MAG: C45 family autoproteolytic acyltransferase/hydrolase [Coriobacteriales bacterium]|nr:C45 family autoproteolytic acyltransferase/hydrolase [Coriobacteriales bacterium]